MNRPFFRAVKRDYPNEVFVEAVHKYASLVPRMGEFDIVNKGSDIILNGISDGFTCIEDLRSMCELIYFAGFRDPCEIVSTNLNTNFYLHFLIVKSGNKYKKFAGTSSRIFTPDWLEELFKTDGRTI